MIITLYQWQVEGQIKKKRQRRERKTMGKYAFFKKKKKQPDLFIALYMQTNPIQVSHNLHRTCLPRTQIHRCCDHTMIMIRSMRDIL